MSFGLAEGSRGVDRDISVETLADGGDRRERRADFKRDTGENELLAAGCGDRSGDRGIVEGVGDQWQQQDSDERPSKLSAAKGTAALISSWRCRASRLLVRDKGKGERSHS